MPPISKHQPLLGLIVLLSYVCYQHQQTSTAHVPLVGDSETECPHLPGLEDVLVVLKTGVTEAREKVPVHVQTTLRCVPNYVIFSDYDEEIAGMSVHDVLRNVSDRVKAHNPDFSMYNRVRAHGRAALTRADLNPDTNSAFGKPKNPGWKLDKWKFLPMLEETLAVRDDAKWYVFMEADTYFFWPNLLAWLAQLEHQRPYYLGNQMQIGDVVFAHGGSGFVLSMPAVRAAVALRAANLDAWDKLTDEFWAGDCVLGKALADVGVPLTWSWPVLHTGHPGDIDFFSEGYRKRPWCYAPIAYHHLTPAQIKELWRFERSWMRAHEVVLYRDVFERLVQPALKGVAVDWSNRIGDKQGTAGLSAVECRVMCYQDKDCVQYSFAEGVCYMSGVPVLGSRVEGVTSGWVPDRIDRLVGKMGSCPQAKWIV
ncbi:hypothetical protein BDV25DRAFT_126121 [Aspergillus avenaceus]|uniref:N-acetylgalactosaminide beta-1,3-galactosyltransferase n=1 Tax=Aspergillus avenaceus TaxID=36643 RepID=A0A5N6U9G0_ASPAV|nr:hypothetical protein BDV25DRAFT_126121 [Aspergillus avenaceus]